MDQATLEKLLSDLPLGPICYFDTTGSTNDEAARWAEAGAPDLALVVADEQTAGRGRAGRRWFTPPGAALAFSLVLRPLEPGVPVFARLEEPNTDAAGEPSPGRFLAPLTALGALAVNSALREWIKKGPDAIHSVGPAAQPEIKWPNDVLLGGRKVAGVLAEAHWMGDKLSNVILGIGLNIAPASLPPPEELLFPATCVESELGRPVDRWALLHDLLKALLSWRARLGSNEFMQAWEAQLAFRGQWVLVGDGKPPLLEAQVLELNQDGTLRMRTRAGEEVDIQVGDVYLRPENSEEPT